VTPTVLVTGAHGSLGTNLVDEAVVRGFTVRALVRNPAQARLREGLTVVQGDALDAEAVTRAARGCDALFHLVNVSLEQRWIETTARLLEAAIAAARSIWFAAARPGGSGPRGRMRALPAALVRAAGVAHPMARHFADVLHLWEDPVLLDGAKIRKRFPGLRFTPYAQGLEQTLAWLRANPDAKMYY